MTLFKTWEQHYINGTLPKEWQTWGECRTWAINNRYKMEYGYKGEFSPQGCLKAMPGYKEEEPPAVPKTTQKTVTNKKPPQKGGVKNASKKANTRSRNGDSV
jgi:hypothetical protein